MRRRDFIKGIAGSLAVWPLAACGQQAVMPVIGAKKRETGLMSTSFSFCNARPGLRNYGRRGGLVGHGWNGQL